jgi:hypothetical protein
MDDMDEQARAMGGEAIRLSLWVTWNSTLGAKVMDLRRLVQSRTK